MLSVIKQLYCYRTSLYLWSVVGSRSRSVVGIYMFRSQSNDGKKSKSVYNEYILWTEENYTANKTVAFFFYNNEYHVILSNQSNNRKYVVCFLRVRNISQIL